MALLIGVDIGTTNLKAVLYDAGRGEIAAVATRPTPVRHPRAGWSEFGPHELWAAVAACIRGVAQAAPQPGAIAGLAVSSMGESGVPLDAAGRPLYPIMAWYDPRGDEFVPYWRREVGDDEVYRQTGQPLSGLYGINRVMWLAAHHPEVIGATRHWLSVADYAIFRLSGALATDYTLAARTMAFSPPERAWSGAMLAAARVPPGLFPLPHPSGTRVGAVSVEAAGETGLRAGTPVVTGGHDHLCGALAVGAVEPGLLLNSTGTTQAAAVVTDGFVLHPALQRVGYATYNHVVPGMYIVIGGLASGGKMVEWFVDTFYDLPREERYGRALAEALAAPAAGVVWLPHLRGSGVAAGDPLSRAACVGLDESHTRGAVLRGLVESLGYALRQGIDAFAAAGVPEVSEIIAIGGGARSEAWVEITAGAVGRPIRVPALDEAVAVGAALLAGIGAGVFAGVAEARRSLRLAERVHTPDPAMRPVYEAVYTQVFERLHASLRDVNHALADIRAGSI